MFWDFRPVEAVACVECGTRIHPAYARCDECVEVIMANGGE